jgi:enoyl-CoA hydratase/carnithine racemase
MTKKRTFMYNDLFYPMSFSLYRERMEEDSHLKCIQTKIVNGVGQITLQRPEVMNAINFQMIGELEEMIQAWRSDDQVKVIYITGSGERAFAAGGDLKEFHQLYSETEAYGMLNRMGNLLLELEGMGKLTVAGINGLALGGGCELALACDIRMASDQAEFGLIQARLGITTGWGSGARLIEVVGRSQALHWLIGARRFSAKEALSGGLIQAIYPAERFREEAFAYVQSLAEISSDVIQSYVKMANEVRAGGDPTTIKKAEIRRCAQLWSGEEHHAAVRRFLER